MAETLAPWENPADQAETVAPWEQSAAPEAVSTVPFQQQVDDASAPWESPKTPWETAPVVATQIAAPWEKEAPAAQSESDFWSGKTAPETDLSAALKPSDPNALSPFVGDPYGAGPSTLLPGKSLEDLDKPIIPIPKPENTGIGTGLVRAGATALEGLETTKNLGIAILSPLLPAPLQKAVGIGFGAKMLSDIGPQVTAFKEAKTPGERAEIGAGIAFNTLFSYLGFKHGLTPERPSIVRPESMTPEQVASAIKNTREPLQSEEIPDAHLDGIVAALDATKRALYQNPDSEKIDAMKTGIQYQLKNVPPDRIAAARIRNEEERIANLPVDQPNAPTAQQASTTPAEVPVVKATEATPSSGESTTPAPEITDSLTKIDGEETAPLSAAAVGEVEKPASKYGSADDAHVAAYDLAQKIANDVAKGQPDSVAEAAHSAAYDRARQSIEADRSNPQFNPDFMRRAAKEAAGREAAKLGTSLDEPIGEDETTRGDVTPSEEASPDTQASRSEYVAKAQEELGKLSEDEQHVLNAKHQDGASFASIGEDLGVTGERARQIYNDAIAKMKASMERQGYKGGPGAMGPVEALEMDAQNRVSGIRNRVVDQAREDRGLPARTPVMRRTFGALWDTAMRAFDKDPEVGTKLVDELGKKPRPLTDEQDAILTHEQMVRQEAYDEAVDAVNKAETPEEKAEASALLNHARDRVYEVYEAGSKSGTESGRGLNARKLMVKEDYSLAQMENQVRAARGGKAFDAADPKDTKMLSDIKSAHERLEELDKKIAEKEEVEKSQRLSAEKNRMIEATINELGKQYLGKPSYGKQVLDIARQTVERWKNEAAGIDLDKEIGKFFGSESGGVGGVGGGKGGKKLGESDAARSAIVSKIALKLRAEIGEFGLSKAAAISEYVGKYGEKIRDIVSEAWKQAQKLISQEKIPSKAKDVVSLGVGKKGEKTTNDISARAKAESAAGELTSKTAYEAVRSVINSGVRGEAEIGKAALGLLKKHFPDLTMNELDVKSTRYGQAKFPSTEENKVALAKQMRLRQMQAAIEDVKARGETAKSGVQRAKADADVRQRQSELRDAIEQYGKETPPTPEQLSNREAAAIRGKQNAIEDLNRELATGEKKLVAAKKEQSPAVAQLQAELDSMRDYKKELDAAGKPEPTAEDIAATKAQQGVDRAAAALDRQQRINSGEIKPEPHEKTQPLSALEKELRDRTEELRKAKRDAEKATPEQKAADAAQREVDRAAAALDRQERINKGEIKPEPGEKKQPLSALAKELKDRTEELRKAKRAAEAKSPEERRLESLKNNLRKQTDTMRQQMASGQYVRKPKTVTPLDSEAFKLKSERDRVRQKFQAEVEKIKAQNRTPSQKFWDAFVGVERAFKLSSDAVLAKLASAAVVREGLITPLEKTAGTGVKALLPGLEKRASRTAGFSLDAEMKAKAQLFTKGMQDAWDNLRMRKSDLETSFGNKQKGEKPPAWYDYLGFLHGALKAPVKRAEFARSLTERMKRATEKGEDIDNPQVMLRLSQEAYIDANRAIFNQDNVISRGFNAGVASMENSKSAPNLGPAMARLARFLVPVVKVPINIAGEVATGVHGTLTGSLRAAHAYVKGIESLPPEQADAILRQLKTGLVGNALLLTGYLASKSIGGFYQKDKRGEKDVQPGYYRVGGVDLPPAIGHSTAGILMNVGATINRVENQRSKTGVPKGVGAGALAAGSGVVKELPFIPAATSLTTALESEEGLTKYIHEMITSSTTPGILQHAAKLKDTPGSFPANLLKPSTRRIPSTNLDAMKIGVPGLREQVPKSKPHR